MKRSNYSFLSELFRTTAWSMEPGMLAYYRSILLNAHKTHAIGELQWEEERQTPRLLVFSSERDTPEEKLYTNAGSYERYLWKSEKKADDQIIHVTPVQGPITHGGAMCAYGTREMADAFLYADAHPKVIGHLIILDTPGGSANANDLNEVFSGSKKPVVGLIRGMNASKGVHISSFIPYVYAENENVEIGSIGVLAAFSGIKNGTTHEGETFYELYAKISSEKNEWYREAIQNGNTEPLQNFLDTLAADFVSDVKNRWPNVKEDRLHGKMFPAKEVVGELVDGILSYQEAVNKIFELAGVERKDKGVVTPSGVVPGSEDTTTTTSNTTQASTDEANENNFPVINDFPAATEVTTEEQQHTNPQNSLSLMKIEQLRAILGDDVKAEADEAGNVVMTPELNEAVANAFAEKERLLTEKAQSEQQLKQTIEQQKATIEAQARETRPLETGAAPNDNALEGEQEISGSILEGVIDMSSRMKKVKEFAEELGLPIKP